MTVLLLLTGEHLEEVDGVKNERDGTPEVWAPQGSFFVLGYGKSGDLVPSDRKGVLPYRLGESRLGAWDTKKHVIAPDVVLSRAF